MSTNTKLAEALRNLLEASMVPLTDESLATRETIAVWDGAHEALAAHDAEQAQESDPTSDAFKAGMAAMEYAIWEGKEPCPCRKQAAMLAAAPTPPAPEAQQAAGQEQDERAAFEAWYNGECDIKHVRLPSGEYMLDEVEAPWHAWQARAALAQRREPLTDEQIAEGRYRTWAAEPEDAPEAWAFMRGARWAEKHFGIGAPTGEQR